MLCLDKAIKSWKDSASFCDHINLYGFWNETTFLTKSGDLGVVLRVAGVDYESLDYGEQEYAVKRLEAALKNFGPSFHIYQYLFKTNRPEIPFARYENPVVQESADCRKELFREKADRLFEVEIYYAILLEGSRSKTGVSAALRRLSHDPAGAFSELKAQFTNKGMKTLLRSQIERDLARLEQQVQAFVHQLSDFVRIDLLNHKGQFRFFRRLVNYDDWRIAGEPGDTQFLDYQIANSLLESERDHLRVGDDCVRILTMKEAIGETRPLALDALLKIPVNFIAISEWVPLPAATARKEVNKRRQHFNISKTGFISQLGNDPAKTSPRDVLVDESKQADIEDLGDCLRALGDGQQLGEFSLTILLYGKDRQAVDSVVGEFAGIFTNADGTLFAETYNQLNAYFAIVPGNYAFNLRRMYLLNTNYADLSFLFTIQPGEKTNTSRFASNLVYTRAPDQPSTKPSSAALADSAGATGPQQNIAAVQSALEPSSSSLVGPRAAGDPPAPSPAQTQQLATQRKPEVNIDAATGQPYVIYEGTTLDAVLMNRLDGDAAGPVKVLVSNPVYSHDRQHVLVPEGTIVLGEARKIGSTGFGQQRRLAVVFHRMIMPDGYSADLDQFHGLDQIGEEGLKDKVNNHYMQIFGTSIALGVIAGAGEIEEGGGTISTNGSQAFATGASASVSQSATTALDRFIQIPPSITIREGHRVKVYFTQDMLLPAYENHTIPQTF